MSVHEHAGSKDRRGAALGAPLRVEKDLEHARMHSYKHAAAGALVLLRGPSGHRPLSSNHMQMTAGECCPPLAGLRRPGWEAGRRGGDAPGASRETDTSTPVSRQWTEGRSGTHGAEGGRLLHRQSAFFPGVSGVPGQPWGSGAAVRGGGRPQVPSRGAGLTPGRRRPERSGPRGSSQPPPAWGERALESGGA